MALRIPPLNSLRTFVMAARKGSFLEAANELHITPAAVSRSIRSLEDHLGFPLFHRSHRQVRLTDEGERYLRELGDVFERITLATKNLVAERTKRPLVVCSYPSFMIDWLIPRWSRVHKSDPRIELKFVTTHTHEIDFESSGIHAAILTDRAEYRGCTCEKIFTGGLIPICAPGFLPPGATTENHREWQGNLLQSDTRPNDWQHWAAANGHDDLNLSSIYGFESSKLLYQAVAARLGIGIGIREVLTNEFASRSIVNPFPDSKAAECPFYLIWPEKTGKHPFFGVFRSWLFEEVLASGQR